MPLIWFRADLRLTDHPALHAAAREEGEPLVAVFLLADQQWREHGWGAARVAFLLRSLQELSDGLAQRGIPLLLRSAPRFAASPAALLALARQYGLRSVHANAEYEWNEARRDDAVATALHAAGLAWHLHHDQCLIPPGALRTGSGDPYRIFTPFKRAWLARCAELGLPTRPLPPPRKRASPAIAADPVPASLPGWVAAPPQLDHWQPGERAARSQAQRFAERGLAAYARERDRPDRDGTSRLSPALAAGCISPASCIRLAAAANAGELGGTGGAAIWISELVWREFYRHVLVAFPRVCKNRAFQPRTEAVAWRDDAVQERAWQEGRTGCPIVDAGMRQLAATGWMHNRVRMITAMYFSKNLLLDWRRGEAFFAGSLIDCDLAANNGGWQWSASTGTDAAPYFRVFNPSAQAAKCDPEGTYIRRWVPELADCPTAALHDPTQLPPRLRQAAGYPAPLVDLGVTRQRAIAAFRGL